MRPRVTRTVAALLLLVVGAWPSGADGLGSYEAAGSAHAGNGGQPVLAPQSGEILPPLLAVALRRFEPPPTPFAAGHRGIDLSVTPGQTELVAAIDGRLSTGVTVGNRYVTIESMDGSLRVTLSYLTEVLVANGTKVTAGDLVAVAGTGHGEGPVTEPHTHLSVRRPEITDPSGWAYVDPMPYMRRYLRRVRGPVTRLAL